MLDVQTRFWCHIPRSSCPIRMLACAFVVTGFALSVEARKSYFFRAWMLLCPPKRLSLRFPGADYFVNISMIPGTPQSAEVRGYACPRVR
eukprot:6296159-Amphidinium_carterae.1